MDSRRDDNLTEFKKKTVYLMVHKFVADYKYMKSAHAGEELEHFFEDWAPRYIREIPFREQVWHAALIELMKGQP